MTAMRRNVQEVTPTPTAVIVEFVEPIPGFSDEDLFSLSAIDEQGMLFALRSVRSPELRFIVVAPGRFFPDYLPVLDELDVAPLQVEHDDEVQVLVIVTICNSIDDATANLLAPIIMVPGRNTAMQVILSDENLSLRAPLLAATS